MERDKKIEKIKEEEKKKAEENRIVCKCTPTDIPIVDPTKPETDPFFQKTV